MKRTRGEDIWQFRFYETTKEGLRRRRAAERAPREGRYGRQAAPVRIRERQLFLGARDPAIRRRSTLTKVARAIDA